VQLQLEHSLLIRIRLLRIIFTIRYCPSSDNFEQRARNKVAIWPLWVDLSLPLF
jgi:hypothetical protein